MSSNQIFVGRKEELDQFKKTLQDPKGQAILVVGQAGMGKTLLVNKMAEIAQTFIGFECGCVRYGVVSTDTVDTLMAQMMDNAFETANIKPGSFDNVSERKKQWSAIFSAMGLIPVVGNYAEKLVELAGSLKHDPARNTREQFLNRLEMISKRMPKNGRAVFIIDPEKNMQEKSDEAWAIVVKDLPDKIKFIFAQRNEDVLVDSELFSSLNNVIRIPRKSLDALDESVVDELIGYEKSEINYSIDEIKNVISGYNGNPYAVGAALGLLKAGAKLEELPKHPEPLKFAKMQWGKICEINENAIRLFITYAILEVSAPEDIVEHVSELNHYQIQHLTADNYLKGLLRDEGEGKRIYHSILSDYILGQMNEDEKKKYHKRVIKIYRGKLKTAKQEQTKPDELAAIRLPEHVLAVDGENAFVNTFIGECISPLQDIGAFDVCIALSERALKMVSEKSKRQAIILNNLAIIYSKRGQLGKAEEIYSQILLIAEEHNDEDFISAVCINLGEIYISYKRYDDAEIMVKRSLTIAEKMNKQNDILECYNNLCVIYQGRDKWPEAGYIGEKALSIAKKLGNKKLIAATSGNLGLIYNKCGKPNKAEQLFKDALKIYKELGIQREIATTYINLSLVYFTTGNWDKAEDMCNKALEIQQEKGLVLDMAGDYRNLGIIYKKRGDNVNAKEYWIKSRDLYIKIGLQDKANGIQRFIDEINDGK